jgi:two-component system, chemotaxis family, CheB/CheR fusion protein
MSDETNKKRLIVGIGASAGGLNALEEFFDNMPSDTGMTFIIVQHLSPDFKSLMDDLLSRHTEMEIFNVTDGIQLKPNTVYLNPPKSEMSLKEDKLFLKEKESGQHFDLPIDKFFTSLADEFGESTAAVVLSGTGSDGSRGIKAIHSKNGLVIAQLPESCQFDGMPRSSIATGICDAILPPKEIASLLAAFNTDPETVREKKMKIEDISIKEQYMASIFSGIFDLLKSKFNIDFSKYKFSTVSRRIIRRLEYLRINKITEYADYLIQHPEELDSLYKDLLIGVTEFFRDPKIFQELSQQVFPEIFINKSNSEEIRIWSAGCATGEEAYSLAIIALETAKKFEYKGKIIVFATDVHKSSLDFASLGLYEYQQLKNVPDDIMTKYFRKENERYRIISELRKFVVFAPHNLINDPPFTKMDLICCRNLLIYLQPEIQEKIISVFHFSLRLKGVLLLGKSEGTGRLATEFDTVDSAGKIFRKINDVKISLSFAGSTQRFSLPTISTIEQKKSVAIDKQLLNDYDILLKKYVKQGILVNEKRQIIHVFGESDLLIGQHTGRFENDIFQLVNEEIKTHILTSFNKAYKSHSTVITKNVISRDNKIYDLAVDCLYDDKTSQWHYYIGLVENAKNNENAGISKITTIEKSDIPQYLQQRINDLEQELTITQANLQATIEELQTSNEELQATNEELLAANEELQSTNEELHSLNEELYTVNSEFEAKNEELKKLNQDHENLLASTEVGTVFVDSNLRIRKFNPAIGKFFKLMVQDIGRPIDHIAYQLKNQKQMLEDIKTVLDNGNLLEKEELTIDDIWILKRVLPFKTENNTVAGVVLTFTDITKIKQAESLLSKINEDLEEKVAERTKELENEINLRKQTELKLENSLKKYKSLFEMFPSGITISDTEGNIIETNKKSEHLLGIAIHDQNKRKINGEEWKLIKLDGSEFPTDEYASVIALKENRLVENVIMGIRKKDGLVTWINVSAMPMQIENYGVAVTYSDISDRIKSELELKKTKEQAEVANEAKSLFLASMSHEIRTPMNGILGMSQLLANTGLNEKQNIYLEKLKVSAENLMAILDDIIDFSKIESGKIEINPADFDFIESVNDIIDLHKPRITAKNLNFEINIDSSVPQHLIADKIRIKQVLSNLIGNAIKFTDTGSIGLSISAKLTDEKTYEVSTEVYDTGIGIGDDIISMLFKPFTQGDSSISRKFGGTGLGLSICKRLCELMGGRIWVESYLSKGSRFFFTFKAGLSAVKEKTSVNGNYDEKKDMETRHLNILVAEDDAINQMFVIDLLKNLGHKVTGVQTGGQVIDILKKEPFDIVLMDISMPDINGIEALKMMRSQGYGIPVIALTAHAILTEKEEITSFGFDSYVTKPFFDKDLIDKINSVTSFKQI